MKRALKLSLVLFLVVSMVFITINTKTSARADTRAMTDYFQLRTAKATGTLALSSTLSGNFVDSNNERLVFYIPLYAYISETNFVARYVYDNSSSILNCLFYSRSSVDISGAPLFVISFKYLPRMNNSSFVFNSIGSPHYNVETYFYDILHALSVGFRLQTLIDNGSGHSYGATNILDDSSYSYLFLTSAFAYGYTGEEQQELIQQGIDQVLNNPTAYDLVPWDTWVQDMGDEYEAGFETGRNTGYTAGYDAGFEDGQLSDPDTFKFNTILKRTFRAAADVMNMEIVGPLKLIHFVLLPMLLSLFAVVLKIFRS